MNDTKARLQFSTLFKDFNAICDCGGRLSGTESEARAVALLKVLGREATGLEPREETVVYEGWQAGSSSLTLGDGSTHRCHPLVRTIGTDPKGVLAEVVDLGRGSPEDFEREKDAIPGRIVLVRHELMFSAGTIHRRLKYQASVMAGAAGFLIAGPEADSLVAGSSGRGNEGGIPAAGISPGTAARLEPDGGSRAMVLLSIDAREKAAQATNLFFELPGKTDDWVVLSAHIDGHDLAESAMDNASGLAVALSVAREIASVPLEHRQRGLRLALFNIEEWALLGSEAYVAAMTAEEKAKTILNVNVDSVGYGKLTALISDFPCLRPFLLQASESCGVPLEIFEPTQRNSDHFNFANVGIPAFRLVAGFDDVSSAGRLVLTERDTRERVELRELMNAAQLAHAIVDASLTLPQTDAMNWRRRAG